ncbi:MAG: putative Ig domain-containing protein [Polyangiaceae bacterium]|nr:putative Ig domain-containing protein [Polyangiaceae bacterium]
MFTRFDLPAAFSMLLVSLPAAAQVETGPHTTLAVAPGVEDAKPPIIDGISPQRYAAPEVSVHVGQPVRFFLRVRDPEGRPLSVRAFGMPEGAAFSAALRKFTWTPSAAQRDVHTIRFVVSNGAREASHTVTLRVGDNRPPRFSQTHYTARVGDATLLSFSADDPDGDPLTYSASNLPSSAHLDRDTGNFSWQPADSDVGALRVEVTASDGIERVTQTLFVEVELPDDDTSEEWESYLLPGLGYALYAPHQKRQWGLLHGVALEVIGGAWIHRNNNRGPSHGRIYVSTELLNSTEHGVPILFTYALGFSLSLERNPRRTWLIPVYGLDLGGMLHRDMGAHFQSTPYVGAHFYSNPNVFLSGRAGYRLVPTDLETLGGWHASVSGDFSIW